MAAATRTTLLGSDVKLKYWTSPRAYLLVQAEVLRLDREEAAWDDAAATYTQTSVKPIGGYVYADYNFNTRYNVGASYERFQEPTPDKTSHQAFGTYVGFALLEETTAVLISCARSVRTTTRRNSTANDVALAAFITRKYRIAVNAADWPAQSLPAHLQPRVEVIDQNKRTVTAGRDLASIRASVRKLVRRSRPVETTKSARRRFSASGRVRRTSTTARYRRCAIFSSRRTGGRSIAAVYRELECQPVCGKCKPTLREMIGGPGLAQTGQVVCACFGVGVCCPAGASMMTADFTAGGSSAGGTSREATAGCAAGSDADAASARVCSP